MADEHDEHEDDLTTADYYRLGKGANIFHDNTNGAKLLAGQVVKLEPTERVAIAFRHGHIVKATENQFKKYQEKVKEDAEKRAAEKAAANPTAAAPAAPATVSAAKTQAAKIIEDAQREATKITEEAEADAEKIRDAAKKPEGGN